MSLPPSSTCTGLPAPAFLHRPSCTGLPARRAVPESNSSSCGPAINESALREVVEKLSKESEERILEALRVLDKRLDCVGRSSTDEVLRATDQAVPTGTEPQREPQTLPTLLVTELAHQKLRDESGWPATDGQPSTQPVVHERSSKSIQELAHQIAREKRLPAGPPR